MALCHSVLTVGSNFHAINTAGFSIYIVKSSSEVITILSQHSFDVSSESSESSSESQHSITALLEKLMKTTSCPVNANRKQKSNMR